MWEEINDKESFGVNLLGAGSYNLGGMYVVSKVVLTVIQPLELVWLRYVVALITLCLIGVATHQSWHIHRRDFGNIIAIGVIGYAISIWTQFVGTKLSSAQMGAMIKSATPAFMVIFAYFILKEKITFRKGLQMVDAASGGLFFFFQPIAGTLLAWFFLGEQMGLSFWIGAVLIFSGVFLVVKEP